MLDLGQLGFFHARLAVQEKTLGGALVIGLLGAKHEGTPREGEPVMVVFHSLITFVQAGGHGQIENDLVPFFPFPVENRKAELDLGVDFLSVDRDLPFFGGGIEE